MIDDTLRLALETMEQGKQVLIFLPSRASAEKTAEDLSQLTSLSFPEFEKEVLHAISVPTRQCRRLSHCVKKGVAFHHAGLVQKQRDLIESQFRVGNIKAICCTPTLAAGISTPAFRVIIKSLKRYSGSWGMDWIPVLEFMQMAGRAGRPEFGDQCGEAIVLAKDDSEKEDIYEKYICGKPEDISSKLAVEPVLRTYLLSLISSGIIRDEKTMNEFFSQTFWAHQFQDLPKLERIMVKMLSLLEQYGFVKIQGKDKSDFCSASKLTSDLEPAGETMHPTPSGKRVSELYLDPLTARHFLDCLHHFDEKKEPFSLLQMVCHTLEMRPLLRVRSKEQDIIQGELVRRLAVLLEDEPSAFDMEYDDFVHSIKTALFLESWINEKDEDYLLENYDIRPGEIRGKLETADWLLYAAEELARLEGFRLAVTEIAKLRLRVQHGAKEELLPLLKLRGIGRVRARKLYSHGLKGLKEVKAIDVVSLGQILGRALAEDVKKQLGDEVQEVPEGKRKGQMSIKKF